MFAALNQRYRRAAASRLDIEITENLDDARRRARGRRRTALRDSGVRVSIDDFGTRYASFGYLQRFSVSSLKLDQAFVRDVTAEHPYSPIIVAIVGIARGFDLHLVAEGVETPLQRDILRSSAATRCKATCSGTRSSPRMLRKCCAEESRR